MPARVMSEGYLNPAETEIDLLSSSHISYYESRKFGLTNFFEETILSQRSRENSVTKQPVRVDLRKTTQLMPNTTKAN